MSASGRVCEITNGRFVEAKHEKRWLAVRLLRSKPAGRFGSGPAAQRRELDAREQSVRLMFGNRPLLPTRMGRWRRLPSRSHWRRVLILSSPGQASCFNIAHEGNSVAMRRRTPGDI